MTTQSTKADASRGGPTVKKWTVLGQDPDIFQAMWANLVSWFVSTYFPSYLPRLLPPINFEETEKKSSSTRCISIGRPGGLEQLRVIHLQPNMITKGYNVGQDGSPFISTQQLPPDCVIVQNHAFSVNYADCCIRWGLYESAKQFVGWPIVPGFDIAGVVVHAPPGATFRPGDKVFGCTLFGAYSSRIAVPQLQLRKVPTHLTLQEAASIPAVSLTALYALHLAGHYPLPATPKRNRSILIHSAAGGVGSMAIQMAKLLGLTPIVGVVGSSHKVEAALKLGCNYVIDKSKEDSLWDKAREYAPEGGYATILDANGISTLRDSYNNLCPTGRLIVFGFHSNLPLGKDALSPRQWLLMAIRQFCMPTFDAMDMVVANKSVMGFNLSFLSDEREFVSQLWNQIHQWLYSGDLQCPRVVTMDDMQQIGDAHELIMSGQSVGKIVVSTEQPSS